MLPYDHEIRRGGCWFYPQIHQKTIGHHLFFFLFLITRDFSSEKNLGSMIKCESSQSHNSRQLFGMRCGVLSGFPWAGDVTWMGGSRAGAGSTQPRQPWLLFHEEISCCLATTQTWCLFVYSSSCAQLSSDPKLWHSTGTAFNSRAATDA